MAAFTLFFAGHIGMVMISGWSNFVSIVTGWKKVLPQGDLPSE